MFRQSIQSANSKIVINVLLKYLQFFHQLSLFSFWIFNPDI